eukprot:8271967-Karenia_brevis.AAC.1
MAPTSTLEPVLPTAAPANQIVNMDQGDDDQTMAELKTELNSLSVAIAALPDGHPCRLGLDEAAARVKQAIYAHKPLGARIDGLRG